MLQQPSGPSENSKMKVFGTVMGAALIATGVSAQNAVVKNNCKSNVYVQSFPYDGSNSGPLTTVAPGQSFTEAFRTSGSVGLLESNIKSTCR